MAENKNNLSINDDHSNAAMTHTSDAIASSDFIIRELDLNQEPEMQRESKNFWQDAWAQLKRNKLAVVGMIGLIIIVIFAFIGPVINKHDYAEQNVEHRNLPAKIPVLDKVPFLPFDGKDADGKDAYKAANAKENYWFGTDQLGRDLWTRTWKGAQISLFIGVVAAMLDIFIGVVYGAISGFFGGRVDTIMQRILEVIASIPNLIVVILQYVFAVKLRWFPVAGWEGFSTAVLPSLALSAAVLATVARYIRAEMIEVLSSDYILLARAKGNSTMRVLFGHALRNALIPIITIIVPMLASILTGTLTIENIFGVPGLGDQFVRSITTNDFSVIMAITLLFSTLFIVSIFIVDILYGVIDPRIRVQGGKK
ncbi:Oligopeptide transport system permease protein oppC [Staphylococcus aureus]|nr:Oligopeptide transport system permease protein oppC [Staphylococcus aureus]